MTVGMYAAGYMFKRLPSLEPEPPGPNNAEGIVFHNNLKPAFMHFEYMYPTSDATTPTAMATGRGVSDDLMPRSSLLMEEDPDADE